MSPNISEIIFATLEFIFYSFAFLAILSYIILAVISVVETGNYMKKNSFVNYNKILSSSISPSISIIAPAYNETLNIVENVRSLLSTHYVNYDVIIVNDGSKDDSLEKLIKAYDLVKVDYLINQQIPTKPLR
ncbi:glycosyltransferase [Flavobacterium faecale]|uniref:glycosyltransferase n=1 Tax=Flavobacterium faecale TaxID=1355330 RepID=UPI003AAD2595